MKNAVFLAQLGYLGGKRPRWQGEGWSTLLQRGDEEGEWNMNRGNEALIMSDEELLKMPASARPDYVRRNENIKKNRQLCDGCAGTGNVTFSKYTKCEKCDGKGHLSKE